MSGPDVRPGGPAGDDALRGAPGERAGDGAGPDAATAPPPTDPGHEGTLGSVRRWLTGLPRPVRLPLVVVTGSVLLLAGAAMLVLPGPGLLVMFAGVAVLAAEFPWAGRLVVRIRAVATRVWVPVRRWLRRER